jgi:hypothetical protein
MGSYLLDDSSPDLGDNPGSANIRQNNSLWGNVTGTNNLYSGFFPGAAFDIAVRVVPDGAIGAAGWTTVVFQLRENAGTPLSPFTLDGLPPVEFRSGPTGPGGRIEHWYEWHLPGSRPFYSVSVLSPGPHAAIDALIVDTIFTPGDTPIDVVVPEPAAARVAVCGLLAILGISWATRRNRCPRATARDPCRSLTRANWRRP